MSERPKYSIQKLSNFLASKKNHGLDNSQTLSEARKLIKLLPPKFYSTVLSNLAFNEKDKSTEPLVLFVLSKLNETNIAQERSVKKALKHTISQVTRMLDEDTKSKPKQKEPKKRDTTHTFPSKPQTAPHNTKVLKSYASFLKRKVIPLERSKDVKMGENNGSKREKAIFKNDGKDKTYQEQLKENSVFINSSDKGTKIKNSTKKKSVNVKRNDEQMSRCSHLRVTPSIEGELLRKAEGHTQNNTLVKDAHNQRDDQVFNILPQNGSSFFIKPSFPVIPELTDRLLPVKKTKKEEIKCTTTVQEKKKTNLIDENFLQYDLNDDLDKIIMSDSDQDSSSSSSDTDSYDLNLIDSSENQKLMKENKKNFIQIASFQPLFFTENKVDMLNHEILAHHHYPSLHSVNRSKFGSPITTKRNSNKVTSIDDNTQQELEYRYPGLKFVSTSWLRERLSSDLSPDIYKYFLRNGSFGETNEPGPCSLAHLLPHLAIVQGIHDHESIEWMELLAHMILLNASRVHGQAKDFNVLLTTRMEFELPLSIVIMQQALESLSNKGLLYTLDNTLPYLVSKYFALNSATYRGHTLVDVLSILGQLWKLPQYDEQEDLSNVISSLPLSYVLGLNMGYQVVKKCLQNVSQDGIKYFEVSVEPKELVITLVRLILAHCLFFTPTKKMKMRKLSFVKSSKTFNSFSSFVGCLVSQDYLMAKSTEFLYKTLQVSPLDTLVSLLNFDPLRHFSKSSPFSPCSLQTLSAPFLMIHQTCNLCIHMHLKRANRWLNNHTRMWIWEQKRQTMAGLAFGSLVTYVKTEEELTKRVEKRDEMDSGFVDKKLLQKQHQSFAQMKRYDGQYQKASIRPPPGLIPVPRPIGSRFCNKGNEGHK